MKKRKQLYSPTKKEREVYPEGGILPVYECFGNTPRCLERFITSRENQTECFNCLKHKGLLELHPLIDVSE